MSYCGNNYCGNKDGLVRRRMRLAGSIVHCRLMIQRNYHPEFFEKLLMEQQTEQSDVLRQERKLDKAGL